MNYLVKGIDLFNEKERNILSLGFRLENNGKMLERLSKINLFVGANNSGKSRFLRSLLQINPMRFKSNHINFEEEVLKITKCLSNVEEILRQYDGVTIDQVSIDNLKKAIQIDDSNFIIEGNYFLKELIELIECIKNLNDESVVKTTISVSESIKNQSILKIDSLQIPKENYDLSKKRDLIKKLKESVEPFDDDFSYITSFGKKKITFKRVYIPILRGLRQISSEDIYKEITTKDYFKDQNVEIFTGLSLYEDIINLLLGTLEEREMIKEFQEFLSEAFFDLKEVTLVPNRGEKTIFVKIGCEEEYPIHDLGDGIQSLIIMTFPIFKYRNENLLLFIEEPELNLHPGMQRRLMEILYSEVTKTSQLFMTTHSNHLLDITLDAKQTSIFTFKKELFGENKKKQKSRATISNVSSEEINLLELLGVRNSAVFLTNCTIWIEGITDRLYIKKYLELYQKKLKDDNSLITEMKEDVHYSFVEYSGNNITHWSFLYDKEENDYEEEKMNADRLCAKLFLISDMDGLSEGNGEEITAKKIHRHEQLKNTLQERYYCLKCREIENLLSPKILKNVIADYENLTNANELKLNQDIRQEDYKSAPIGNYIESLLVSKKRRGKYEAASGTITDKLNFCKKAISYMKNYEDLSLEAKELTEKIYNFILLNNS